MKNTLFVLFITFCFVSCKESRQELHQIRANQIKIDSTLINNDSIENFIAPFKNHLNSQLDSTLGIVPKELTKNDGNLESTLGNLMADICFEQTEAFFKKKYGKTIDFVLLNHGGIRAPISAGKVTARNAFEVMPFENELVVVELSGTKTQELLTYLSNEMKAHPISNMELEVHQDNSNFRAIINNKSFDSTKTYHVLTSDYLQQGGDKMIFFSNPIKLYNTKYKLRNALIDYFKKTDTLKSQIDQRFTAYETKQ